MLNPSEEDALRKLAGDSGALLKLARDKTPMRVMNPGQNYNGQATEGQHIGQLLRTWTAPVVVAGQPLPPTDNRPLVRTLGEDAELLAKTEHVRGKGERLMQFFARTGLGASQIRAMGKVEIARFVDVASRQEQPQAPVTLTEPAKPRPAKFYLEV